MASKWLEEIEGWPNKMQKICGKYAGIGKMRREYPENPRNVHYICAKPTKNALFGQKVKYAEYAKCAQNMRSA